MHIRPRTVFNNLILLTGRDRTVLAQLASKLHSWKEALMIVQSDRLLRWHAARLLRSDHIKNLFAWDFLVL